jgi:hypothetical protein
VLRSAEVYLTIDCKLVTQHGPAVKMTGKRVISAAQHRGNQASILCMKFGWW